MIVKKLMPNLILAEIAVGCHAGTTVLLPRMDMTSSSLGLPFEFKRRQFPIRVCFAMTINKAQGQTLDKVGIYLKTPVFAHGQLYVAFSRVRSLTNIYVQVQTTAKQGKLLRNDSRTFTPNIVYRAVLVD